jgi:hypothetical protein
MSVLVQRSATGVALARPAGSTPIFVRSITLTAAAAAATVAIDDSSDGSATDLIALAAPVGTTVQWRAHDSVGAVFFVSVYATLAGAGALLTIEHG